MTGQQGEHARVCGGSTCPTCGRQTEAMLGPCAECCDLHARTGRFRRRVASGGPNPAGGAV